MNLENKKKINIIIKLSGEKIGDIYYNGTDFETWYQNEDPIEKYIFTLFAQFIAIDGNGEECGSVGYMYGNYFDLWEIDEAEDINGLVDLCDMDSQELYDMACALTEDENIHSELMEHDTLVFINRLYVEPEFRNIGLGSFVIKNLSKMFEYKFGKTANLFILEPVPQEKEGNCLKELNATNYKAIKRSLIKFYRSCGYEFYKGSKYMVKK